MNSFALGFILMTGCGRATTDELVLRACVEVTIPRHLWAEEVRAELKRQKVHDHDCAILDRLCAEYQGDVAEPLRWRFNKDWKFEEQLWLVSGGKHGNRPSACEQVCLRFHVLRIGRAMSDNVKVYAKRTPRVVNWSGQ